MGYLLVSMAQSKFWQPRLYSILDVYVSGLSQMSLNMEKSWSQSELSIVQNDERLGEYSSYLPLRLLIYMGSDVEARPTTTNIWHGLKSLLFATVLTTQSILDVVIYYPTVSIHDAKTLSRNILMTFCRLSFISSKFGVLAAEGGGFTEMKRAFFGALDVLSSNSDDQDTTGDRLCSKLISDLATELAGLFFVNLLSFAIHSPISLLAGVEGSLGTTHPIYQGRVIYFLVCTEHVIGQLDEETITRDVLPIVQRLNFYIAFNTPYTNHHFPKGIYLILIIANNTRQRILRC